jgi:hypothetical protein
MEVNPIVAAPPDPTVTDEIKVYVFAIIPP